MTSAVLDTNVLVSGFTNRRGASGQLLQLWLADAYDLIISVAILEETVRTFQKPYFRSRMGLAQIAANLDLLRRRAFLTPITRPVHGVATHPEDDLILAAAVSSQADYLVTGDTQLQALRAYLGITVLSPSAFLQLVSTEDG